MNPQGHVNGSYESPGTRNGDYLNPSDPYESPGTRSEPMVQQATLHDQEIVQHRLRCEWLDEHWPWIQENSGWQDLGGAEKHYMKFPKEFQRLQERYEAAQAAVAEDPDELAYQVLDPDAENQEAAQAAWGQVLESLKEQVPAPTFATYLQETEGHTLDVDGAVPPLEEDCFLAHDIPCGVSLGQVPDRCDALHHHVTPRPTQLRNQRQIVGIG
jgi:hypothetical protein